MSSRNMSNFSDKSQSSLSTSAMTAFCLLQTRARAKKKAEVETRFWDFVFYTRRVHVLRKAVLIGKPAKHR